jgi:hypothetical protein
LRGIGAGNRLFGGLQGEEMLQGSRHLFLLILCVIRDKTAFGISSWSLENGPLSFLKDSSSCRQISSRRERSATMVGITRSAISL